MKKKSSKKKTMKHKHVTFGKALKKRKKKLWPVLVGG